MVCSTGEADLLACTFLFMGHMTCIVMTGNSVMGRMTGSVMGHTTNITGLTTNSNLQITKNRFKAGKGLRLVIPSASHGTAVEVKRVFQRTT